MKTILLLGSSGMLGGALKRELTRRKINYLAPSSSELNLLDNESTLDYFSIHSNEINVVINAAGFVGGLYHNLDNNAEFYKKNFTIGCNVSEAVRFHNHNNKDKKIKILYFGSSCQYSARLPCPYKEEDLYFPVETTQDNWGYATAKAEISRFLEFYDLGTTIIPPNLYGIRRISDTENIENKHLMETIAYSYHRNKEINFKCDSFISREILSADELARVVITHMDKFLEKSIRINVGTGYASTMEEIASVVPDAKITYKPGAYSSLVTKYMDVTKFKELTGENLVNTFGLKEYFENPFY